MRPHVPLVPGDRSLVSTPSLPLDWMELLRHTSRSFVVGIEALEPPLRDQVGQAYLLCRLLDTFEDATGVPVAWRANGLDQSRRLLEQLAAGQPLERELVDWKRVHRLEDPEWESIPRWERQLLNDGPELWKLLTTHPVEVRRSIRRAVTPMIDGMEGELRRPAGDAGRSTEELDRYCFHVAGTVGLLLNDLFAGALQRLLSEEDAVAFGKLLQLVNVTRDFSGDWAEGRCYWPGLGSRAGRRPNLDERRRSFSEIVALYQRYRPAAHRYLEQLGPPGRRPEIWLFCAFPLKVAEATMELALADDDWMERELPLKLPRREVEQILATLVASLD